MRYSILFPLISLSIGSLNVYSQSDSLLWYKQPAAYFEETLVLGNGKTGASLFGGTGTEKIYLNDATLWTGEPVNPDMNKDAHLQIPAIRDALKQENYPLADSLQKKVQGKFSESYAPLGTLYLDFPGHENFSNYYRELNLGTAMAKATYDANGVHYTREYFISHPSPLMIIRLTSSKKGVLEFNIRFESLLQYRVGVAGMQLQAGGRAPVHAEPSYRGDMHDAIVYRENRGTRFSVFVKIKNKGGQIVVTDSTLGLKNGTEAVLFISVATSFNGFNRDPFSDGLADERIAQQQLDAGFSREYGSLRKEHIRDYRTYFSRVRFSLGKSTAPNLPTDERLKRYAEGGEDKNLEILYFQFGRYLLISSSRTPGVPANLQGIWNPYLRPPWSSNYTININTEENYWLAETTNLPEMHESLMSFIRNLFITGRVTAKNFFGIDSGWAACHNSDIWAMSNPVGDFGKGDPVWANWYMGGVWLSSHLWEHYIFSGDKSFLQNTAWPIMAGAARFCLGWLVEDPEGNLITAPCTSPENIYITPTGYKGASFYGGTGDLAMIRELLTHTIRASEILKDHSSFREQLKTTLQKLHPFRIGKKGNLQEWYYDWEDAEPQHRHQSHLFGLHPGSQITPDKTPELAEACRKTLEIKGDNTTGWSKGWRINLWARLRDGNRAYKMYRELLRYVEPDEKRKGDGGSGGTYPNLFDAHPPFQIDGNFGGSAAVAEMLMQSTENEIRLLPALPNAWKEGYIKGICARGGFIVSMQWEKGILKNTSVLAKNGGKTTLIFSGTRKSIQLKKGQQIDIKW